MTFVTPTVTQGGMLGAAGGTGTAGTTGSTGAGMLGAESATSGMSSLDAIAASQPGYVANGSGLEAVAASQPGYVANGAALDGLSTGTSFGAAGKAVSNYNTMNKAMGGGQQQRQAPASRPVFQGEQAPISQPGQPGQNQNAVLAAIARRRQRGF